LVCGAIAIHDTSSVVAANKYGPQALQIATTVKLLELYGLFRCFDYCNFLKIKRLKSKFLILLPCLFWQ
jgi:hypothetical protein